MVKIFRSGDSFYDAWMMRSRRPEEMKIKLPKASLMIVNSKWVQEQVTEIVQVLHADQYSFLKSPFEYHTEYFLLLAIRSEPNA